MLHVIVSATKLFYSQLSAFFLRSMPSASSHSMTRAHSAPFPRRRSSPAQNLGETKGMERGTPRVVKHANPALYARSRSKRQCSDCGRGTRNMFLGPITYRRCSRDLTFNEQKLVLEEEAREGGPLILVRSWPNLVLRITGSR